MAVPLCAAAAPLAPPAWAGAVLLLRSSNQSASRLPGTALRRRLAHVRLKHTRVPPMSHQQSKAWHCRISRLIGDRGCLEDLLSEYRHAIWWLRLINYNDLLARTRHRQSCGCFYLFAQPRRSAATHEFTSAAGKTRDMLLIQARNQRRHVN